MLPYPVPLCPQSPQSKRIANIIISISISSFSSTSIGKLKREPRLMLHPLRLIQSARMDEMEG
jgi:hypothetical protein